MFRHRGKARTFKQNFRLAAFLSLIAGMVNICGVLLLGVLTTNVTGHFAYFAEDVLKKSDQFGIHFLLYIIAFLAGSFISSLMTEFFYARNSHAPHNASMFLEIILLLYIGLFGDYLLNDGVGKPILAYVLLFSMGLQNSLVSKISDAAVRTTHLTGLFTDLGIELSQLFFYRETSQREKLKGSIKLRCGIISFFFAGCVAGGLLYNSLRFRILVVAAIFLVIALVYDNILVSFYKIKKKLRGEEHHDH